jgi:hypothetical protein
MPERKTEFVSSGLRRRLTRLRKPPQSEGLTLGGTCGLEIAEADLAKENRDRKPKLALVRGRK